MMMTEEPACLRTGHCLAFRRLPHALSPALVWQALALAAPVRFFVSNSAISVFETNNARCVHVIPRVRRICQLCVRMHVRVLGLTHSNFACHPRLR